MRLGAEIRKDGSVRFWNLSETEIMEVFPNSDPTDSSGKQFWVQAREALDTAVQRAGIPDLERLSISVPYGCGCSASAFRTVLMKDPPAEQVQVLFAPESAALYFAWKFQQETGVPFAGNLLLVDFSGYYPLTFLMEVSPLTLSSSSVRILDTAGPVQPDAPGADFALAAVLEAMHRGAVPDPGENSLLAVRTAFWEWMRMNWRDEWTDLQAEFEFEELDPSEHAELDRTTVCSVPCGDRMIRISMDTLLSAYRSTAEKEVSLQVAYMKQRMTERGIPFDGQNGCTFRLAVAGSPAIMEPVRRQLRTLFRLSSADVRGTGIRIPELEASEASGRGCALLAAERIRRRMEAPFSVGLESSSGDMNPLFAFRKGDELEPGQPYYPHFPEGSERPAVFVLGSAPEQYLISPERNGDCAVRLPFEKWSFRDRKDFMEAAGENRTALVGFSLSSESVLNLHIRAIHLVTGQAERKESVFPVQDPGRTPDDVSQKNTGERN